MILIDSEKDEREILPADKFLYSVSKVDCA